MDRTIISWNVPNMITVPLMAFGAFLIVGVVWQLIMKAQGTTSQAQSNPAGTGGY